MPSESTADTTVTAAATMKLDLSPVPKSPSVHAALKLDRLGFVGHAKPVTRSFLVWSARKRIESTG